MLMRCSFVSGGRRPGRARGIGPPLDLLRCGRGLVALARERRCAVEVSLRFPQRRPPPPRSSGGSNREHPRAVASQAC